MKKINFLNKRIGMLSVLLFISFIYTYAIKAYPGLITVNQPDGKTLTIQMHGDEFYKYRTTSDGYLVTQNAEGFYVYANVDVQGRITASSKVAKNQDQRDASDVKFLTKMPEKIIKNAPRTFSKVKSASKMNLQKPGKITPYVGSKKGLVILVNFSDKAFSVSSPTTSFTDLLNQTGYSANGGTGSAKDYFMASSYGKFIPQFDVVGPYTLPQNMAYYGANDVYGYDVDPVQMVVDACTAADNAGVDFTQYDENNDGYVDNVFVYYAGYNEAEGASVNTVWPHRWGVYPTSIYGSDGNYTGTVASITFDGKIIMDYACTSELKGTSGTNMCGIGTFCHEFGHVLGLPDYYDTNSIQEHTLDYWDIMDYGAYNNSGRTPPVYSAYDRFYLGYFTPTEVKTPTEVVLYPISQETNTPSNFNNQAIILSAANHNLDGENPTPNEFFVLEYRKKTGWDAYLPAEGLLIWHIDYDADAWYYNEPNNYTGSTQTPTDHMRVYLQPLSGSTTTPGTAFTTGSFIPTLWTGTTINRNVTEITKNTNHMWFKVMDNVATSKVNYGLVESDLTFPSIQAGTSKSKNINIKTAAITGNLSVTLSGTDTASFTVNTNTITQATANSATGYNLLVTYTPASVGMHTAVLTISGGGLNPEKVINLSGTAY
ncbi:M6 family metalloprotease domain protein [uncultured Paludibacter sp.]|nr:M6 family metalloprotease domain protein [uncultured Paludibacter sp.]